MEQVEEDYYLVTITLDDGQGHTLEGQLYATLIVEQ